MNFTQPICRKCWDKSHPDRQPVCVVPNDEETCCYCGHATTEGIYIRVDPRTVKFPRP